MLYTDPNGEFLHIIIGAVVGGAINLGFQVLSGNIHSFGDGLKAFGVGAIAGLAGGDTSGIITGTGFMAGAGSGAITGFAAGFSGSVLNSYISGAGFSQILSSGLKGGLLGAGSGALIGGISQGINAARNGGNFFTGNGYFRIETTFSTELGGDLDQNNKWLKDFKSELDYSSGKYKIDKIEMVNDKLDIFADGTVYYAKNNIIQQVRGGEVSDIGGITLRYPKGIFNLNSDIYLSAHQTLNGLKLSLNHELIHAFHFSKNLNNIKYSEFSANMYSNSINPASQFQDALRLYGSQGINPEILKQYTWPKWLLPM